MPGSSRPLVDTALIDSNESFRLLVSNVQDYAIYILDPEGNVVSWNPGAERIKGYSETEVLGQHFSVFYTPQDRDNQIPEQELVVARSGHCEAEGWRVRKDGTRFFAHVSITPLYDDNRQLSGYAKVTRDVSGQRKLIERFRQIVDSAPNAMVMISDQGIVEMVNTQAEKLFGYSRDEILGQPVEILVPSRMRDRHPEMRSFYFVNPQSRPMGKGRDLYALRKDGTEFPVEIGLNPIQTEEGTKVLSAIVDISERKRMEARLRQVVDSTPNAMVMINQQGLIEMVNAQVERVFGYAREELLGEPVEKLVPDRFRKNHPDMRKMFFTDPQSRPMGKGRDLYALRKDGTEFPVEIGLNPIQTDEGTKVLSAIVDISDRKQKEQKIEAALKEKDVLLGEIHHRVKNNLQIVHSLLDLQSMRITDANVLDMLRDSQNRIRSMALIHQSLYQSKDFAQVHFNTVLDSLVPSLIESYQLNNCVVGYEIDADDVRIPLNLAVPCGLIVNELITNALKHAFCGKEQGNIFITLKNESHGALLQVNDDGVGIPESVDVQQSETLGLQLVGLLAGQIGSEIDMQRANPTMFSLHIPIDV